MFLTFEQSECCIGNMPGCNQLYTKTETTTKTQMCCKRIILCVLYFISGGEMMGGDFMQELEV